MLTKETKKLAEQVKKDVRSNLVKKVIPTMPLAISPSMLGINTHTHYKYVLPSFDDIILDLNDYYHDDFSNHVKVRNENLEYDENEGYKSYAYFEVKDLNILIKATILVDHFSQYLSFEFSPLNSRNGNVIGTLDADTYQYKDFNIVPIEKHVYDMLFHFTMDHYNLYSDDYDDID